MVIFHTTKLLILSLIKYASIKTIKKLFVISFYLQISVLKKGLITHWVCTEMLWQSICRDEDHAGRRKLTILVTGETADPL